MCRCWVVDGETCRKKETKMGKRLYVGNLSYSTTEADLRDAFVASGHEVAEVKLEMSTDEGAQAAIESLNGKDLQGRTIAVSEARERTGGGGRGGFHGGDRGGFQGGDRGGRRQRW
jgi:cold-inducible RNA-binding protein